MGKNYEILWPKLRKEAGVTECPRNYGFKMIITFYVFDNFVKIQQAYNI